MTAYRALFTQGGLRPDAHVLIPGIGGGVALMALIFAKQAGARVTVTSRSTAVLEHAAGYGADQMLLHDDDWTRQRLGPVDLVVDSVGSAAYGRAIELLRPGGVLVSFGATTAPDVTLDLRDLFFRQIEIKGSSMASAPEFAAMLRFVAEHEIVPPVGRVYALSETAAALEDLRVGRTAGKLAVEIAR
jgi:zinc-binding alcohol dehydrogenase/oxidoreductase